MSSLTIGLVPHPTKDIRDSIGVLRDWDTDKRAVFIARTDDAVRVGAGIELVDDAAFVERADVVVALGGDGTMLGAMRLVAPHSVPVLGVNYGNLGFLVEVEPDELAAALDRITADDFQIETHHALEVRVSAGGTDVTSLAFNDLAIARVPGSGVVSADLSVDGTPYGFYKADALVVATSSGSTAYNYAAGGPVMSPSLAAFVITPVAPMTGFDRSVVLSDREPIEFEIGDDTREAVIEVDGRIIARVGAGARVGTTMRKDAASVIRLDAERHANRGRIKLSLLDLPLRRDQLLELIPESVRPRSD